MPNRASLQAMAAASSGAGKVKARCFAHPCALIMVYEGHCAHAFLALLICMCLKTQAPSTTPAKRFNALQYVELYTEWLLSKSVEKQFHAFAHGFHQVWGVRM